MFLFNEKKIILHNVTGAVGFLHANTKYINLKTAIMKKYFKISAVLLSATIILSSCIGSFRLTNNIKDWNENVSEKWVNEVIFIALHIIPVYEIAMLVDGVVLNSIEFWTGESIVEEPGEKKIVTNSNGQEVEITALENGYTISNGETSMDILFDEDTRIWSAVYGEQVTNLIKLVDSNNAQLFLLNGDVMDITLDADGINMARQYMTNSFALSK